MAEPTVDEMLANVRTAINNLLTGGAVQSYSINGRSLQRYSLKELRDLEQQLQARKAAESNGGSRTYASFSSRPT